MLNIYNDKMENFYRKLLSAKKKKTISTRKNKLKLQSLKLII